MARSRGDTVPPRLLGATSYFTVNVRAWLCERLPLVPVTVMVYVVPLPPPPPPPPPPLPLLPHAARSSKPESARTPRRIVNAFLRHVPSRATPQTGSHAT